MKKSFLALAFIAMAVSSFAQTRLTPPSLLVNGLKLDETTVTAAKTTFAYEGGWDFKTSEVLNLVTAKIGTVPDLNWLSVKAFTGLASKTGSAQQLTGGGAIVATTTWHKITFAGGFGYALFETANKPHTVAYLGISGTLN